MQTTLKKQVLGFVITGCLSTMLMYLLYLALIRVMGYQEAYAISYVISVLALYFMNNHLVFKQSFRVQTFLKFPLIYLLQYAIGAFSLEFLIRLGVPVDFAPIVIITILLPVTFYLNRLVLFKK